MTLRFWLDPTPRPGWQNMAIDCALLDLVRAGEGSVLRVYRWEPWCLSFGRHEPVLRRYGRAKIDALGVDVVRRPTGGRAVWHARELTYAVAQPAVSGSLRESYRAIHGMMADAVRRLGAPALLAADPPRVPGVGAGACFAMPVGGEVIVAGRKVVGSAQLRMDGALLQHGSMLLGDDQRLVRDLAGDGDQPAAEVSLSTAVGRPVAFEEAAGAVRAAAGAWRPDGMEVTDAEPILALARSHEARFRSEEWTWSR
jgi:lipoate-protein ligase A